MVSDKRSPFLTYDDTSSHKCSHANAGIVVTTRTVAAEVPPSVIMRLLDRHLTNDWGDLPHGDELINSETVNDCEGRVMSSYSWPGLDEIWITVICN